MVNAIKGLKNHKDLNKNKDRDMMKYGTKIDKLILNIIVRMTTYIFITNTIPIHHQCLRLFNKRKIHTRFNYLFADCGCSTAFIRVWAALGLATKLRTLETNTIQKALIDSVQTNQDLKVCLESALHEQKLQEEHYLQRNNC